MARANVPSTNAAGSGLPANIFPGGTPYCVNITNVGAVDVWISEKQELLTQLDPTGTPLQGDILVPGANRIFPKIASPLWAITNAAGAQLEVQLLDLGC